MFQLPCGHRSIPPLGRRVSTVLGLIGGGGAAGRAAAEAAGGTLDQRCIPQVRFKLTHPNPGPPCVPLRQSSISPFVQPTAPPAPAAKPTVAWTRSGWRGLGGVGAAVTQCRFPLVHASSRVAYSAVPPRRPYLQSPTPTLALYWYAFLVDTSVKTLYVVQELPLAAVAAV